MRYIKAPLIPPDLIEHLSYGLGEPYEGEFNAWLARKGNPRVILLPKAHSSEERETLAWAELSIREALMGRGIQVLYQREFVWNLPEDIPFKVKYQPHYLVARAFGLNRPFAAINTLVARAAE